VKKRVELARKNDPARRLDNQRDAAELCEGLVPSTATSSGLSLDGRCVLQAIGDLPEDDREAFDLVLVQGITHTAATQVLGVSGVTAKRRLNRGLRLLAEQLADLRPEEDPPDSIQVHTGGMGNLRVSQSWNAAA
jgi:RNA polymerase sigma-70 factor (ECF subfamily)